MASRAYSVRCIKKKLCQYFICQCVRVQNLDGKYLLIDDHGDADSDDRLKSNLLCDNIVPQTISKL